MSKINRCKCGFPIRPLGRVVKETIFGEKRIIAKHVKVCPKCKNENIVYG